MKIGEIFARKWVKVYYVDLRTVKNIDTLPEEIMIRIVDSFKQVQSNIQSFRKVGT